MKALSIKQPWAWLICAGYKDIENRDWARHMPPLYSWRGYAKNVPMRIYVHAGKKFDQDGLESLSGLDSPADHDLKHVLVKMRMDDRYACGAIIGEVDITGCVDASDSPWFVGKYGFILANPKLYKKPIPCRGKLGFYTPEIPEEVTHGS